MPVAKVHRISATAPDDVSGIEAAIAAGRIDPKGVMAVLGKTEGNGLVNDFARGYAALALSLLFQRHLSAEQTARICLVMSGGTEGGMAPHWTVFERVESEERKGPALAIGRAHTPALPAEHLGRMPQVEMVAAAVHAAMADVGITDLADVHYVQVKCPLLTVQRIGEAEARGATLGGQGHAPIHGAVARRERAGRGHCARRSPAISARRRSRATGMCGRGARVARQASSCWVTRSSCSACRRSGAGRSPSITP